MNKIISFILLLSMSLEAIEHESSLSSYVRGTYHSYEINNAKSYQDDGIGGKLHYETAFSGGGFLMKRFLWGLVAMLLLLCLAMTITL